LSIGIFVQELFVFIVEKLTLQVPWKNLYTHPTKATIDGLFLLVVPKTGLSSFVFVMFERSFVL
jgi:hypothetical protein